MTTIVYRDGVMAGDSLAILNGNVKMPSAAVKVWRLRDGTLAGGAGDAHRIARVLRKARKWSDIKVEAPDLVISVTPAGKVRTHANGHWIDMGVAPFHAIGDGAAAALGAMHAGATAEKALAIAALVAPFTGGDVQLVFR